MEKLLTAKEVSDLLNVKPATIYRFVKQGRLRAIKIGGIRFRPSDVEEFVSACATIPEPHKKPKTNRGTLALQKALGYTHKSFLE